MISQIIDQLVFYYFYQKHERILYEQIESHTKYILSEYQGGFWKRFSSRHSLLAIIEKWREVLDNGWSCGALLVDLSKAFDCIVHDLSLAKLRAYGFDNNSLKLINSFLSGRKFRTKIGSPCSPNLDLIVSVPQKSILSPLLFTCAIFFYAIANLTSSVTRTTLPFMLVSQTLSLYWVNLKKTDNFYIVSEQS